MISSVTEFQKAPWQKRVWLRLRFTFYLPYIGAGICIRDVAPDFSRVSMQLYRHFFNKNYLGTHFGGSLYAMCDPVYMMLLIYHLGPDYLVIDYGAEIEFLKTSRKSARALFEITPGRVESIRQKLQSEKKIIEHFLIEIRAENQVIARVKKTIYIRKAGRLKNRRWGKKEEPRKN